MRRATDLANGRLAFPEIILGSVTAGMAVLRWLVI
jgi:hypothetical protein